MTLTIIADDLTGACDTAALFCGRGRVPVFIAPAPAGGDWEVAAVDTESRALPGAEAGRRMRSTGAGLAERLVAGTLFKKIDSTLRGPIGAELDALLSVTGRTGALVCPAFPAQHRTVRDGVLHVDGLPAHRSPVGRDPDYPGATSNVAEILAAQTDRPVRRISLATVRGDADTLARALGGVAGGIAVADAETDQDLRALAGAARGRPDVLLTGAAGLAQAVAADHDYAPAPEALPRGRAWLVVAGSRHPATRAQVERLEEAGTPIVRIEPDSAFDPAPLVAALRAGEPAIIAGPVLVSDRVRETAAARLGEAAASVLAEVTPTLTCVTGGETAAALARALGASRLELTGSPRSGLAVGELVVDGSTRRLLVLTKAGGFGPPDLFALLLGERS